MEALVRRWLFNLDPELAHQFAFAAAWLADHIVPSYLKKTFEFDDPILGQEIWGHTFKNPVGLAAGCDKNALLLPFWEKLGFGHVEVGSVTLDRSKGNPKPRLFRLAKDQAIINRLGLPSKGAPYVGQRLSKVTLDQVPVGINIARTETKSSVIDDFCGCATLLLPYANYLTINISCPNTIGGKILEDTQILDGLLEKLSHLVGTRIPILIKLAPPDTSKVIYDSQIESIVQMAINHDISGFIVSNTADNRYGLVTPKERLDQIGYGGVSGPPLFQRALQMIRYVRSCVGPKYPIIGVGGISSAQDAYAMICAGASLVQMYTILVYEGPSIVKEIKRGLAERLQADGHASIQSAVGTDSKLG